MKRIVVIGASSSSKSINRKLANYAAKSISFDTEIIDLSEIRNINETSYGLYPTVGENLDFINTNNLKIEFLYRKLDQFSWQYCNKGFFNFKNYIPKIITTFN